MDLLIDLVMSGSEGHQELKGKPLSGMCNYPKQVSKKSVG